MLWTNKLSYVLHVLDLHPGFDDIDSWNCVYVINEKLIYIEITSFLSSKETQFLSYFDIQKIPSGLHIPFISGFLLFESLFLVNI